MYDSPLPPPHTQVSTFTYGDISVRVREGALGDGLGAKVWSVCHMMIR